MIDRSLVHSATGIGYYSTSTSASGEGKGEGLIWVYAFFDSTTVEVLLYLHSPATFGVLMIKAIMLSCWSGLVWSGLCTPVHTVRVHVHTYSVWAFERVAPPFQISVPQNETSGFLRGAICKFGRNVFGPGRTVYDTQSTGLHMISLARLRLMGQNRELNAF